MDTFNAYYIERHELELIRRVMKRLYSENRLKGDEMRDLAQLLEYVLNHAIPVED